MQEDWQLAREVAAGAVAEAGRWRALKWATGLIWQWDVGSVGLLVAGVLVAPTSKKP